MTRSDYPRAFATLLCLFAFGCGGHPAAKTIAITGFTIDPERSVSARTGTLAQGFGPSDMTGPCWTEPCDNDAAFMLARLGGVTVSVFQHPEIPPVVSDDSGHFELKGVPQNTKVNIILQKPGDPTYLSTLDAITLRTGTVDIKNLPYHICRNDKIFKALLDAKGPNAIDNGAVLAVINNNVPLPQNGPLNSNITVTPSGGKLVYVGFDYTDGVFIVDDDPSMPNHPYGQWLGAVLVYNVTDPNVSLNVVDTTPTADAVTGRPYTYPVFTLPLVAKSSTFLLLYPVGTGT